MESDSADKLPGHYALGRNCTETKGITMDVSIGMTDVQREVTLEMDVKREEIERMVAEAIEQSTTLRLQDERGRILFVPADRLAYVLVGSPEQRRVGFSI